LKCYIAGEKSVSKSVGERDIRALRGTAPTIDSPLEEGDTGIVIPIARRLGNIMFIPDCRWSTDDCRYGRSKL